MGYAMMVEIDKEAFETNYRDAKGYHRRAEQFVREGQRPSLVFNVASVALERYLVALCALHGAMPMNHNYTCLMAAAETVVAFPPELKKEIVSLDIIFGICSLYDYCHKDPVPSDSVRVLSMCKEVQKLFDP
jgi:HEPN domain-containing protein